MCNHRSSIIRSLLKKGGLFIITLIILSSCGNGEKKEEGAGEHHEEGSANSVSLTQAQFKVAGIQIGAIEQRNLKEVVKANGYLKVPPQNQASISALLGGTIKSINVLEGDKVSKGQILVTVANPELVRLQENYLKAKSNLVFLEKEYERQKKLYNEKVSSGKVFQEAESNYNSEKAALSSMEHQLRLLSISPESLAPGNLVSSVGIVSPIDGYVGEVNLTLGAFAEPNAAIMTITDNSQIHVDLLVYENDLGKVKTGQKVSFVLTNQGNRQVQGEIYSIGKTFEGETKSVAVHARITGEDMTGLIPDMYVNANIEVGQSTVSALPIEAVVKSGGKEYIFIQTEGDEHGHAADEGEHANGAKEEQHQDGDAGEHKHDKKESARHNEPAEGEHHEHKHEEGEQAHGEEADMVSFQMIQVKTGVNNLGYVEILPIDPIPANARVVVKGSFFLLSQKAVSEGGDEHGH